MGATAKPVLYGDNGAMLKATSVLAMFRRLGIEPPYSRPLFSEGDLYVESLFRTAEHRPELPSLGFPTLDDAPLWAM